MANFIDKLECNRSIREHRPNGSFDKFVNSEDGKWLMDVFDKSFEKKKNKKLQYNYELGRRKAKKNRKKGRK